MKKSRTRIYTEKKLILGDIVEISSAKFHHVSRVLRIKKGDIVSLFNCLDGEFLAEVVFLKKRSCDAKIIKRIRKEELQNDIWILFAPIKKIRLDFLIQKVTELGVSGIFPVFTRNTIVSRVSQQRMKTYAISASEQTDRLSVPEIFSSAKLTKVIDRWPQGRKLLVCDETGNGKSMIETLSMKTFDNVSQWAILIGPEGGFEKTEIEFLANQNFVTLVSLGPRLLRADTAAIASLSCWQSVRGDWKRAS